MRKLVQHSIRADSILHYFTAMPFILKINTYLTVETIIYAEGHTIL